jgi:3-phosphoshikimate 1-carboxyvinyltransferase
MTDSRPIEPLEAPFDLVVDVPGSKSLTNRALVCAALAEGQSELTGVLFADDTEAMLDNVRRLGAEVRIGRDGSHVEVDGLAGRLRSGPVDLDARLSGTTSRFLLPVLAIGPGPYRLDGAPSLRDRPMSDGIDALRALDIHVEEEGEPGHLPVSVRGQRNDGSSLSIAGTASSQFLSGLLLVAPCLPDGTTLTVDGPLVSRPYVDMTIAVMRSFGAEVDERDDQAWFVHASGYRGTAYAIEPDASAASYFFAAAAITGGRVRVDGLGAGSLQGDLAFVNVLAEMGAKVTIDDHATTVEGTGLLRGVEVDMQDFSDTAQTLAAAAVFADSPTRITGIGFIRKKETDRIGAVVRELARLGVAAEEETDGLVVRPDPTHGPAHGGVVETYDDHRMAMSFALIGLRVPGVAIADPGCVAKTFPDFFDVLDSLRSSRDHRA